MRGCSSRSSPAPNGTERTNPITAEGIGVQAGPGLAKHWQMTLQGQGTTNTGSQQAGMGRGDLHRAENQLPAVLRAPGCAPKPQMFLHQKQLTHLPQTMQGWDRG